MVNAFIKIALYSYSKYVTCLLQERYGNLDLDLECDGGAVSVSTTLVCWRLFCFFLKSAGKHVQHFTDLYHKLRPQTDA